MRHINYEGLEIIKSFEGIEDGDPTTVNIDPYLCPADIWTIGWGHAIVFNNKLLRKKVDPYGIIAHLIFPDGLTLEECEELLKADILSREIQVDKATKNLNLNDNQFSALVSFVFNVGIYNFLNSTLLKKLKLNDIIGASEQFPLWRRSNGKILNGLVRRRKAEKELFLKEDSNEV